MEQSPLVGYFKAITFAFLAAILFISVWQGTKTEDKITRLDQGVAGLDRNLRDLSRSLRDHKEALDRLRGSNETLLRMIATGSVAVRGGAASATDAPQSVGGPGLPSEDRPEWGAELNDELDANLNPGKPVGTPGRYRNFLRPDPDGPESPENVPNRDGVLNLAWGTEPKGFNFLIENYSELSEYCQTYVLDAPASRHRKRPSSFNWKPALCWRIEVSPDYREYTLFFRRDIHWQRPNVDLREYPHLDGKHRVTAHDLEFTIEMILNPQSDIAHARSYYEELESVEALDDYTAVLRWKRTSFNSLAWSLGANIMPGFVYRFDSKGRPIPEATLAQEFNDHWFDRLRVGPVGNGPYRFTEYNDDQFVRLDRWDEWYGYQEEKPYPIRTRHQRIYVNRDTEQDWLRAGEIDVADLNSARYREWILENKDPDSPFKDGRIKTYKSMRPAYRYIGWKNTDPLFNDKRVRKALTLACNRSEICEKIYLGRMVPMAAPIYPMSEEADPTLEPLPFDLAEAARLLDEAGWKRDEATGLRTRDVQGQKLTFEFTLHYPSGSAEYEDYLNLYRNDLLSLGILMTPYPVQWAQFQKDLQDRKYKAFTLGWATGGWEHDFKQIWHSSGIEDPGSSNYIEFKNGELDELADKLRTLMDPEERVKVIHRIGRILFEEQPYTFLGWSRVYRSYWSYVHGLEENPYFIRPVWRSFPLWMTR